MTAPYGESSPWEDPGVGGGLGGKQRPSGQTRNALLPLGRGQPDNQTRAQAPGTRERQRRESLQATDTTWGQTPDGGTLSPHVKWGLMEGARAVEVVPRHRWDNAATERPPTRGADHRRQTPWWGVEPLAGDRPRLERADLGYRQEYSIIIYIVVSKNTKISTYTHS